VQKIFKGESEQYAYGHHEFNGNKDDKYYNKYYVLENTGKIITNEKSKNAPTITIGADSTKDLKNIDSEGILILFFK
jgi:hypothetical protein